MSKYDEVRGLIQPYALGLAVGALVTLVTILVVATSGQAATYNNIFNNVEQGPNSTSSPSITVDEKSLKKEEAVAQPPAETAAAPALGPTNAVQQNVVAKMVEATSSSEYALHKFRFGMLGHTIGHSSEFTPDRDNRQYGGTLELSYFPLRDLGISAFGGVGSQNVNFVGGEMELVPLHLSLFGLTNFVEAGALLGANTLGHEFGPSVNAHAGARVVLNLGDRFSLTSSVRTNLTDRSRLQYTMFDAGVQVRL